jgi:tetratricopeptide (TPR) repeat protein
MNTKKIIIYLAVAVVFVSAGYFIWQDLKVPQMKEGADDNQSAASTNEGKAATTTAVKSVDKVPEISLNIPDFKKITIDASIMGAEREALTADIKEVIKNLEGNTMNPAAWTQLGILRQQAKDYNGAIAAWKFAGEISAENAIPLLNIAGTYGYYLHDNIRAEEYFKKAIATESKNGYVYFKTYEFYADIKEFAKARAVLEQGITAIPTDKQLKAVLDSLNKTP